MVVFFFQAEDGIRYLVRSRGLGDVYKRQVGDCTARAITTHRAVDNDRILECDCARVVVDPATCLLYTSDAADERSSVDLGGRRIIKKKKKQKYTGRRDTTKTLKTCEQP